MRQNLRHQLLNSLYPLMKKTTLIKTLIFIGLFTFCCFSPAFAVDGAAKETLQNATLMLNFILGILSWAWIPFAYIAGNLLTNSRVYGEILGIDSFLRICWNMIKNISNFLL
ncbi:MAG: hypothetical protein LBI53_01515 [Candidatus Peribacteria bacterium]|nr:hypothetical protein [Candidatus Peribacteria bacterium]